MRYIKSPKVFFNYLKESSQTKLEPIFVTADIVDDVSDMLVDLTDYGIEVDVKDEFLSWRGQDFEFPMEVKKNCLYIRIYAHQSFSEEITNEMYDCILRALHYIKEFGFKTIQTRREKYTIDGFIDYLDKRNRDNWSFTLGRIITDFIVTK